MFFRYKIIIEYDGVGLSGWQKQKHSHAVQEYIEDAIHSFARERVVVYGAGRTDAGVHSLGQTAHFDLRKDINPAVVKNAINHFLKPQRIAILYAERTNCDFHARFDARQKIYIYKILNRESPSPLLKDRAWHIKEPLDLCKIRAGAALLIGKHDFSSFRAASCQAKSPIKTIDYIVVEKEQDVINISIAGRSFLYNQVRIMVGALRKVGNSRIKSQDLAKVLALKNRKAAYETAPPYGLYLSKIFY